ncbi:hypothetical protein [Ensifer sp. 4252]|uniref:hypothetical protein n=1 Tax=Ensifer sp. 4252 TaxID=3373915 RepID=UPI003D2161CC
MVEPFDFAVDGFRPIIPFNQEKSSGSADAHLHTGHRQLEARSKAHAEIFILHRSVQRLDRSTISCQGDGSVIDNDRQLVLRVGER